MKQDERPKSIVDQITEVADMFCENYCKYPNEWDEEEHDGLELFDSEICQNCPLTRLI